METLSIDSTQSKNTKVKVYNYICVFNWTEEGSLLKVEMQYVYASHLWRHNNTMIIWLYFCTYTSLTFCSRRVKTNFIVKCRLHLSSANSILWHKDEKCRILTNVRVFNHCRQNPSFLILVIQHSTDTRQSIGPRSRNLIGF